MIQRLGQGLYIGLDQRNIGGSGALFTGQTVRIERPADLGPGLLRDPPHQAVVGDVLQEDSRDLVLLDLGDDRGYVAPSPFGVGANPKRRDESDTIVPGEI